MDSAIVSYSLSTPTPTPPATAERKSSAAGPISMPESEKEIKVG